LNKVAKEIKEKYSYICEDGDLILEFGKYDKKHKKGKTILSKKFKKYEYTSTFDNKDYSVDIGYERFLGPEMFFHPEFIDEKWRTSLDESIDMAI